MDVQMKICAGIKRGYVGWVKALNKGLKSGQPVLEKGFDRWWPECFRLPVRRSACSPRPGRAPIRPTEAHLHLITGSPTYDTATGSKSQSGADVGRSGRRPVFHLLWTERCE